MAFGLIRTFVGPEDILEYENRKAAKLKGFTIADYLKGDFQDSMEDALSDQVALAAKAKENYNGMKSSFIQAALKPFLKNEVADNGEDENPEVIIDDNSDIGGNVIDKNEQQEQPVDPKPEQKPVDPKPQETPVEPTPVDPAPENPTPPSPEKGSAAGGKYYSVGSGLYLYKDYVVQGMAAFKANQPRLDKYVARYNELIATYSDINFYMYYIERDSDQNYASGSRAGISEYLLTVFNLPQDHMGVEEIRSFEEYTENNYRSDHHWAYKGSYSGYKEMIAMMKPGVAPLQPLDELKVGYTKGSFTKTDSTANVKDDFWAYEFPFPEMEVYLNGKKAKDYGDQAGYIAKAREGKSNQYLLYGGFYGGDSGEIHIYNPSGSGSLMIFGNSYDNAVVKLLASHYEHTYCIDLRYYKNAMGVSFSFSKYIETHPVDDVIAIGNAFYYLQSPFIISK